MQNKMELNYSIKYSDRKTLGISVERDKSVVVRVPKKTSNKKIEDFIERKKHWIYTKLNHPQKYNAKRKKEFVSGSSILYLGRNYKLDIVTDELDSIIFNNKFMISRKHQAKAYELFKIWYMQKAKQKIIPKAMYFANNLGVEFNNINISELQYRWGSCTPKNNLNFNWRLIKAPISVSEYVIVHELAHLLESNHTSRFWNIVKTQLPRFSEARNWLRANGDLLEVDF